MPTSTANHPGRVHNACMIGKYHSYTAVVPDMRARAVMNPPAKNAGSNSLIPPLIDENESDENADYREYPAEPRV